jgi:hypothetical protein
VKWCESARPVARGVCFAALLLTTTVLQPAKAELDPLSLHYPLDMAQRWLGRVELLRYWEDGECLEAKSSPILQSKAVPMSEVDVAPQTDSLHLTKSPDQWDIPPFAEIDPPVPEGSVDYTETLDKKKKTPSAFSGIPTSNPRPSARLRPRVVRTGQNVRSHNLRIPPPFSSVRYEFSGPGLVQCGLYGGTNSFDAEQAYYALRNSLDSKEPLEGFGKEACQGRYKEPLEAPTPTAAVEVVPPGGKARVPFQDIATIGRPEPNALKPEYQMAKKSPAFREVPTPTSLSNPNPAANVVGASDRPLVHKDYRKLRQTEYLVFLSYYPQKALTVEIVLDARSGGLTQLVGLGLQLNRKVLGLEP